jgi:hypothetical protein
MRSGDCRAVSLMRRHIQNFSFCHISLLALPWSATKGATMRANRVPQAGTVLAVGAAIAFAGCGGGADTTTSGTSSKATTPAGQTSSEAAMKHEDSMKKNGTTTHEQSSMHESGDSMNGG